MLQVSLEEGNASGSCQEFCGCSPEHVLIMRPIAPKPNLKMKAQKVKRLSRQQDCKVAGDLGGRVQPASGALPGLKGDVRVRGRYRIETKWTQQEGFRLTRNILSKIMSECGIGEVPVIVLDFKQGERTISNWAIMPYQHWIDLNAADEHQTPG